MNEFGVSMHEALYWLCTGAFNWLGGICPMIIIEFGGHFIGPYLGEFGLCLGAFDQGWVGGI